MLRRRKTQDDSAPSALPSSRPTKRKARAAGEAASDQSTLSLPFASFPTDLIIIIVRNIPLRPRLLVLARVCKRWHDAVHRSISHLSSEIASSPRGTAIRLALAGQPSLRSLTIHHREAPGVRFCHLQSLNVDDVASGSRMIVHQHEPDCCSSLLVYTSLTSISMRYFFPCSSLSNLVARNAATLTALHAHFFPDEHAPDALTLALPALRVLNLAGVNSAAMSLIERHASQLHELRVRSVRLPVIVRLAALQWPRLRLLEVYSNEDEQNVVNDELINPLICNAPQLSQLHVLSMNNPAHAFRAAHCLASVRLSLKPETPIHSGRFTVCSRLSALFVRTASAAMLLHPYPSIYSLLRDDIPTMQLLPPIAAQICMLDLNESFKIRMPSDFPSLPSLRELRLLKLDTSLKLALRFLDRSPALQFAHIDILQGCIVQETALQMLLRAAKGSNLHTLVFSGGSMIPHAGKPPLYPRDITPKLVNAIKWIKVIGTARSSYPSSFGFELFSRRCCEFSGASEEEAAVYTAIPYWEWHSTW